MSDLWNGEFGDKYHERNKNIQEDIANRYNLWCRIFNKLLIQPMSVLEVGAGNGANLLAINKIMQPVVQRIFHATDVNESACANLQRLSAKELPNLASIFNGKLDGTIHSDSSIDLVFTYGVLIHQNPTTWDLRDMMDQIYRISKQYIVACEYFAPTPEEVIYRGKKQAMWRGDFGKLYMDHYNCKLVDYGFAWKEATGLDNVTWWIFEK